MKFTTVTGKDLDEVRKLLDAPLPEEAYKKIGGQAMDLTDISPAWTRRALTSIFGLFGFGWGINHDGSDVELTFEVKQNGKTAADVAIKRAKFWYVLLDEQNKPHVFSFTTTGSGRNEQGNGGWALKGAMTNALSTAASFLGFQESVYMGKRSHHDTTAQAPRSGMSIDPSKTITKEEQTPGVVIAEKTPAPVTPAITPAEAPILHHVCMSCGHIASERVRPTNCPKCMSMRLVEKPTLAAAKKAFAPNVPEEPKAAITTPPTSDRTAPCMACGSVVPVTPTCPDCGASTISEDIKTLHEEMKRLGNNDRAVLLRRASEVTGRKITGYSELGLPDLQAVVYDLRQMPVPVASPKAGNTSPAAQTPAAPPSNPPVPRDSGKGNGVAPQGHDAPAAATPPAMSKVAMVQALFKAAAAIGISTPAAILAELSSRWNRKINSSSELTTEELATSLKEFQGVKP